MHARPTHDLQANRQNSERGGSPDEEERFMQASPGPTNKTPLKRTEPKPADASSWNTGHDKTSMPIAPWHGHSGMQPVAENHRFSFAEPLCKLLSNRPCRRHAEHGYSHLSRLRAFVRPLSFGHIHVSYRCPDPASIGAKLTDESDRRPPRLQMRDS